MDNEQRFRELADLLPQPIFEFDLTGRFTFANQSAFEVFLYTPEDLEAGLHVLATIAPADRERAWDGIQAIYRAGPLPRGYAAGYTALRKDGSEFPVMIYSSLIVREGAFVGIRGVIIDITEQERAAERDRQHMKALEFLSETATDYVGMPAEADIFRYISDRLAGLFPGSGNVVTSGGMGAGTLTVRAAGGPEPFLAVVDEVRSLRPEGLTFSVPPDAISPGLSGSLAEIPGGIAEASFGELPPEICRKVEAIFGNGKIYGIGFRWEGELFGSALILLPQGMALDLPNHISAFIHQTSIALQRRRAETELRESEEKYRTLFEGSSDGICLVAEGRIVDCNEQARLLLDRRSRDEVVGCTIAEISSVRQPDGRDFADVVRETLDAAAGAPRSSSWRLRRGDGTPVDLDVSVTALAVQGSPVFFVAMRDVTERKRAEAALEQANRKLHLLSGITHHDILNQVTGVMGYLEFLEERMPPDPKAQEYLHRIVAMTETIRRQITFARGYEDMGTSAPQWWRVDTVVRSAAGLPDPDVIEVRVETGAIEIFADPMIEMVLSNLFENSVRHGGRVSEIRVSFRVEGATGIVTVEDNGTGIPCDEKERIFQRGFGRNTGFGLFLIREVLSITGMTITETGEEGRGARFEIAVPEGAYRFGGLAEDPRPR